MFQSRGWKPKMIEKLKCGLRKVRLMLQSDTLRGYFNVDSLQRETVIILVFCFMVEHWDVSCFSWFIIINIQSIILVHFEHLGYIICQPVLQLNNKIKLQHCNFSMMILRA